MSTAMYCFGGTTIKWAIYHSTTISAHSYFTPIHLTHFKTNCNNCERKWRYPSFFHTFILKNCRNCEILTIAKASILYHRYIWESVTLNGLWHWRVVNFIVKSWVVFCFLSKIIPKLMKFCFRAQILEKLGICWNWFNMLMFYIPVLVFLPVLGIPSFTQH